MNSKNNFKKIIVILLLIVLTLSLKGCSKSIIGTWKSENVLFGTNKISYEEYITTLGFDPKTHGDITVEFTKDGQYIVTIVGDETKGFYKEKDNKYLLDFSGVEIEATINSGELSMQLGQVIFYFEK